MKKSFFAGLVSCVVGMLNFVISAAMGFGVSVDNLEPLSLFLASLILIFVPTVVGVFAAVTLSPGYSFLWLFLLLTPIVPGFSSGLIPTDLDLHKTVAVAGTPIVGALLLAVLVRARVRKRLKTSR